MTRESESSKRELSQDRVLLYYAFDWDDNILNMPTKIHMERRVGDRWIPESISTHKFAEIRNDRDNWRILDNDPSKAFSEFRDNGPRGIEAFYEDVRYSCRSRDFGPSWDDFLECLTSACIFSIITARGHEAPAIRLGIEWIIDEYLSEEDKYLMYNNLLKFYHFFGSGEEMPRIPRELYTSEKFSKNTLVKNYLDECPLVGVAAPSREGSSLEPEQAKKIALLEFKDSVNRWAKGLGVKAVVGFSDDDLRNVRSIEELFDQIDHEKFTNIQKLVLKSTKNPQKIEVTTWNFDKKNEANSPNFDGTQANVVPFTKWNNMTQRLYPKGPESRLDDGVNDMSNKVGQVRDLDNFRPDPPRAVGIRKSKFSKKARKKKTL